MTAMERLSTRKGPRLRSLLKSERMYELKSNEDGALFLDVVVGGSKLHTVRLELDASERKRWESGGERYLDGLATELSRDELKFGERLQNV
ncbi:MAG: hypothetical protein JST92_04375 [Deltaproteobacteria bacterium]|nr:hypothetical protein [Deltaproteobacteria bacterium]